MWIFTKHGFISIVQHNSMPGHFQVKSRVAAPLDYFWPNHQIEVIEWADYRFRITIPKEEVVPILVRGLQGVSYTSFKNECEVDEDYHYALARTWSIMYNYQQRKEARK